MLKAIEFEDGRRLVVEAEDVEVSIDTVGASNLPEDAEPVAAGNPMRRAAARLEEQIDGLGAIARAVIHRAHPSELEIQALVRFRGTVDVVPFIATGRGDAGLRLTLKWKS